MNGTTLPSVSSDGHARVAGARERLHGHDVERLDAERVVQRAQRHHQPDRRAVGVGDDEPPRPSEPPNDCRSIEREVVRVDLGHQQRHVGVQPVVARVRDHDVAARAPPRPRRRPRRGVEAREQHVGTASPAPAPRRSCRRRPPRVSASEIQWRRRRSGLPGRPLARDDRHDVEGRVVGEQPDERLADGAGGAEDRSAERGGGHGSGAESLEGTQTARSWTRPGARRNREETRWGWRTRPPSACPAFSPSRPACAPRPV